MESRDSGSSGEPEDAFIEDGESETKSSIIPQQAINLPYGPSCSCSVRPRKVSRMYRKSGEFDVTGEEWGFREE